MADKEHILAYAGLKQYEDGLQNPKVVKRKEAAQKTKEAREQDNLSKSAEYDAAKNEQRDIGLRIRELERLLKNTEVVVKGEVDLNKINIGCKVELLDVEYDEEMEFYIVGSTGANNLQNKTSNESLVGHALTGRVVGDCIDTEAQAGDTQYKILETQRVL